MASRGSGRMVATGKLAPLRGRGDNCREIIRAVSAVLRHEPVGLRGLIRIGALPIRRFPVSRLCLRQARDLWVLNRNELKIKGLVDGEGRDRGDVRLGV